MTILEFYEHVLIELNKVKAPSLLLEDFNYFANKAVQQYINEIYNRYDINQQSTDDLSALKISAQEFLQKINFEDIDGDITINYFPGEDAGWYIILPTNYLHMLNCVVTFKRRSNANINKCDNIGNKGEVISMARRLTSDMFPSVIHNAYLKPSYKCPYYFINNTKYEVELDAATELEMILTGFDTDDFENTSRCRIEIRCGDTSKYYPYKVYFDYLKVPKKIKLTYEQANAVEDLTDKLEFPEYVCYEIINRMVRLILENISDPRLQTNIPINQTISGTVNNE